MAAASGGFTDIVEDLIKMGVQVNYKDKERVRSLAVLQLYICADGCRLCLS